MSKKHPHFVFLSVIILFGLLVSLASPTPVFAQDETPPPPATEEPAQPPMEESLVIEEPAATGLPALTGEPAVTEAPAMTDIPIEEIDDASPAVEDVTVVDVLEAIPEDTTVVVLNENGEVLPLVSEEAAKVFATVDPVWCPVDQNPGNDMVDGIQNCTDKFGTPQELIDAMGTDVDHIFEEDGTIYFTADPGGAFTLIPGSGELDAAEYDALRIYNLTLQGGWNGDSGAGFALSGQTNFGTNSVQIGEDANPWVGKITINNISINGAPGDGLVVFTAGDIVLNNVNSNGNSQHGASLLNNYTGGNVTINNSSFSVNAGTGLHVTSNGSITLTGVTAHMNGNSGAELISSAGGVTVQSGSFFSGNMVGGLVVEADGSVTFSNVTASYNGEDGLTAASVNNITLSNVTANSNGMYGANLLSIDGNIWVSDSHFTAGGAGLAILSFYGDIKLDAVSASHNLGSGIDIFNFSSNIAIKNGIFNENGSAGALLGSFEGDVTIICSDFKNNSGFGTEVFDPDGTITFNDVTFVGNGNGEYSYDNGTLVPGTPVITSGGCKVVVGGKGSGNKPGRSLPLHIVPVAGGEQVELDCGSYSGTRLILLNGDRVTLPCPIKDHGVLTGKTADQLPAPLNAGFGFASAMEVEVIRSGERVDEVKAGMTIDFVIPGSLLDADLAILRWDAEQSQWVEVPGTKTGDGHFLANSKFTGVYVLATR